MVVYWTDPSTIGEGVTLATMVCSTGFNDAGIGGNFAVATAANDPTSICLRSTLHPIWRTGQMPTVAILTLVNSARRLVCRRDIVDPP